MWQVKKWLVLPGIKYVQTKEEPSTVFKVFGMTQPRVVPMTSCIPGKLLVSTIRPPSLLQPVAPVPLPVCGYVIAQNSNREIITLQKLTISMTRRHKTKDSMATFIWTTIMQYWKVGLCKIIHNTCSQIPTSMYHIRAQQCQFWLW